MSNQSLAELQRQEYENRIDLYPGDPRDTIDLSKVIFYRKFVKGISQIEFIEQQIKILANNPQYYFSNGLFTVECVSSDITGTKKTETNQTFNHFTTEELAKEQTRKMILFWASTGYEELILDVNRPVQEPPEKTFEETPETLEKFKVFLTSLKT
jgi:hypothetical protein